ncbi:hypothetical protein GAMM_120055 [Gammaproteobacteria bacterium]
MTENTKTKFSDLQELVECCDSAADNLSKLHEQLVKIIMVKKKLSTSASSGVVFSQAQDIASTTVNLEKIDARLSGTIDEVKQLCQRVQLLLPVSNVSAVSPEATSTNVEDQKEQ